MTGTRRCSHLCMAVVLASTLSACGGGGGGGGTSSGAGGSVSVAPSAPTPTPTPTPTPSSTPTPSPGFFAPGPLAAGGSLGMQLEGQQACAQGTLGFNPRSGAQPGWTSLSGLSGAQFPVPPAVAGISLTGVDTYALGFEQSISFGPADRIAPEAPVYDQFFNDGGEFAIFRNVGPQRFDWATLGVHAVETQLCFFAVGVPLSYPPGSGISPPVSGKAPYVGFADGMVTGGAQVQRLFGSGATATFDYAAGTVSVRLELFGRGNAFGDFTSPIPLRTKIADVTGSGTGTAQRFTGALQSEGGALTGSFVGGLLGPTALGGNLAFILSDGAGVQIIGAAAIAPDNGPNDFAQ